MCWSPVSSPGAGEGGGEREREGLVMKHEGRQSDPEIRSQGGP